MRSTGRGKEWYLKKRGSWKILAWSRITEAFLMGLEDSFLGDFCVLHHVSIFFANGSRSLRFVVFFFWVEFFRLHVYSLRNWGRKDEEVYWWAFASFHWRFRSLYLALFVPLSRNFRRLESRENAYSYKSRSQILKVVAKSRIYYSIYPYRCTRMLQMNAPTNRDLLESLFFSIFLWKCYCNSFCVVLSIWSMF